MKLMMAMTILSLCLGRRALCHPRPNGESTQQHQQATNRGGQDNEKLPKSPRILRDDQERPCSNPDQQLRKHRCLLSSNKVKHISSGILWNLTVVVVIYL